MTHRSLLLLIVFVIPAAAQFEPGLVATHSVRIHLAYSGGVCDPSSRIELMQGSTSVARGGPDKNCMVELFGVPSGAYRMVVSGRGFAGIETNEFSVTSFDAQPIEINIPQPNPTGDSGLRSASTSVSDLRVPKRAAKEFAKASREMDLQQWSAAAASLQRAISIYPSYAAAYNNLGVIYSRIGDRSREAEALHQAIAIDNGYAAAYVNLARMDIATNDFSDAEVELKKATALIPEDGVILVLLSYTEFTNHHLEDAVKDCQRVHALGNVPHSFAHWVAAFAYEQKNQIAEAGNEFRTFVSEEPTGVRADAARKELVNIANFLSSNHASETASR